MRVGIIAEGRADLAVIANILRGKLQIDLEDVQFLRPEYSLDETDLHDQGQEKLSNWELVKRECVERTRIDEFLSSPIDEERLLVIHIDTAEAELEGYGVARPRRDGDQDYVVELRTRVIEVIRRWMGGEVPGPTRFAIAVEETDAWVLTVFWTKDTATRPDPKKDLLAHLNKPNTYRPRDRKRLFQLKAYPRYDELTQLFRRARKLEECAGRNRSLRLFVDSL